VLEFHILGPLEVTTEHGAIRLGGPRQRATLAILLLSANRVVSIDRLADDLYAGAPPVSAVTQVQRQISELRKALGSASVIETRSPGYAIRVSTEELDLGRFEVLADEASRSDAGRAAELLRQALGLWRGEPLADLAFEPFAAVAIGRLAEIRLAALEARIEADLELARHRELVAELEELVVAHPLRASFRAQLMLALYRSGRQAEALDAYRKARQVSVEELGIEPMPVLRELERRILAHDPSLQVEPLTAGPTRTALVVLAESHELLTLFEPLLQEPSRELIAVRLLRDEGELGAATAKLQAVIPPRARSAVFVTEEPARDVLRLARTYDVDLVLVDAPPGLLTRVPGALSAILEGSPATVGILARAVESLEGDGVFVPFGGAEHDWAALEIGAELALASQLPLRLVGTRAATGRRDASRLLADASLALQRVVGIAASPLLADPTEDALVSAVASAAVVVVGIGHRWRREGIGPAQRALMTRARPPVLLVHRGPRPGGLAPPASRTRFTWSIEA
jgi:DNA-binding SARP family transcriptional activator